MIACNCNVCHSSDEHDKRLRTSALIEIEGKNILIDAGPDFRQQLLRENITRIDAILITHEHKDHIAGLDDVRALNRISGHPMDIYAEPRVLDAIRTDFAYAFAEKKYPGVPQMDLHVIGLTPFYIGTIRVVPIRVMHFLLPILGFRIRNLTYITDANHIAPEEIAKAVGSDVLVLNALRAAKHLSHFTLSEALNIAPQVGAKATYLTHVSHEMGLYAAIQEDLPPNVFLAYDRLCVEC